MNGDQRGTVRLSRVMLQDIDMGWCSQGQKMESQDL